MKRLALIGLAMVVALTGSGSVGAAPGGCTDNPMLVPMGFESITVSTASIGFTAGTFAPSGGLPADLAVVTIASQNIRYRDDGVAPTDTVGHIGVAASALTVCGLTAIRQIRFIRDDASDSTLSVSYYRGT